MSSTAVLGFIKDIRAKNVAAVHDRLKSTPAQGPNQRFTDPKEQGLTYTLLHKAVEVCSPEIVSALLNAGANVNAADSRGKTPLHWLASSSHESSLSLAGNVPVLLTNVHHHALPYKAETLPRIQGTYQEGQQLQYESPSLSAENSLLIVEKM
jgi:hypothetical protein